MWMKQGSLLVKISQQWLLWERNLGSSEQSEVLVGIIKKEEAKWPEEWEMELICLCFQQGQHWGTQVRSACTPEWREKWCKPTQELYWLRNDGETTMWLWITNWCFFLLWMKQLQYCQNHNLKIAVWKIVSLVTLILLLWISIWYTWKKVGFF